MDLQTLVEAVQDGDKTEAVAAAQEVIQSGRDVHEIIRALTAGMREIGGRFARMEIFLPEMMMAAQAMKAAMGVIEPELQESATGREEKGTVVIGTVEGDMHAIGKDIVITMLEVHGFDVHDLGVDVNALDFVHKAEEVEADIIGASALMTTTIPGQKEIVELLEEKGVRDRYHVILGGAPVTPEWVEECGADSWGENAAVSIQILERIIEEKEI